MDQELDDPLDWSVDQVVRYLCYNDSTPWSVSKNPSPRPERSILEAALREHGINGEVLLDGRLEDFLRNALNLKEGPYYTINRAIQYAQRQSPKFQALKSQETSQFASATFPMMMSNDRAWPHSFNSPWSFIQPPTSSHNHVPQASAFHNALTSAIEGNRLPDQQLLAGLQTAQTQSTPRVAELDDEESISVFRVASPVLRSNEDTHIDEQGRKRRRLNLTAIKRTSVEKIGKEPTVDSNLWYLGPTKLETASLFYPTPTDTAKDNWSLFSSGNFRGQRLFVRRKMHAFFRKPAIALSSPEGTRRFAIFPYEEDAVDKDKPRYYTLYTSQNGRTEVSMKSTADSAEELPVVTNHNLRPSAESPYDYLLKKYPEKENEDLYPVYGESGSEGGYDSDTWREIDEEREQAAFRASKFLSAREVDLIIDQCITKYEERWTAKHLPKLEHEAHKLWFNAFRNKCRNSRIKILLDSTERLKKRLEKIRKELHGHDWTQSSQLEGQCESMEPTIFELEAQKRRISILELPQCPPKPHLKSSSIAKQKRRVIRDPQDEESLDSESEGDSLDDFIEDDMEVDLLHHPTADETHDRKAIVEPQMTSDTPSTPRKSKTPSNSSDSNAYGQYADKETFQTESTGPNSESDVNTKPRCGFYYSSESESDDDPLESNLQETVQEDQNIEVIDLTTSPPKLDAPSKPGARPINTNRRNILSDDVMVVIPTSQKSRSSFVKTTSKLSHLKSPNTLGNTLEDKKKAMRAPIQRQDPREILERMVEMLQYSDRSAMIADLFTCSEKHFKQLVKDGLVALSKDGSHLQGMSDGKSDLVFRAAVFYIAWVNGRHLNRAGIIKGDIRRAINDIESSEIRTSNNFTTFALQLRQLLEQYSAEAATPTTGDSDDEQPTPSSRTSHLKKRRRIKEDQAVKSGQVAAKQRVEIQEQQRKNLEQRLKRIGVSNSDPELQAVSFEQPTIFLHPHIGRCVKPHQLAGIQFMWRELVQNDKRDGCLLAHTMGLGKTMQVISLLVTIAAAANSSDPAIRKQVPQFFHRSQTLILCPPSLIDNWYEEFLMWTPKEHVLGPIRKITSVDSLDRKVSVVELWDAHGGILILSYHLFRSWVAPEPKRNGKPVSESQVPPKLKDQLLKGPRIIVADEAHQMKNKASQLAQAAALLESKSRIALTGSPLANNLIDYYAMINWISPKYLDEIAVFREKYLEPIEQGLFADSTYQEQRRSLKKLQVLKEVIAPKINRADISVLEGSLPMKVEFVITVPLTDVQKKSYNQYVTSLLDGKTGSLISSTTLLSWLAVLGLCCNHPACFYDKLAKRAEEQIPKNTSEDLIDQETYPAEVPLSSLGFDEAMWASQKEFLSQVPDLDHPKHSHRAGIFQRIVDESVRVGDKILCFSQSIPTLDYLENLLRASGVKYNRLDGSTAVRVRQEAIRNFNNREDIKVYLISTRAGGLGLNITGANRVIIFDFGFNPTWEEQAVGRAYRLGQKKPVYIYRFLAGGTFEDIIHNKSIFKTQLAMRVVDKKNVERSASKSLGEYLYPVKDVKQEDLTEYIGRDLDVLDKILLQNGSTSSGILSIALTETFRRENDEMLTEDEKKETEEELELERLRMSDPVAYERKMMEASSRPEATMVYPSTNFGFVTNSNGTIARPNALSPMSTQNDRAFFNPPPWAGTIVPSSQSNIITGTGPPPSYPDIVFAKPNDQRQPPETAAQTILRSLSATNTGINSHPSPYSAGSEQASGLPDPISVESLNARLAAD